MTEHTNFTMNQPLHILCDHDDDQYDHILGYFVGYGSFVGDPLWNEPNAVYSTAIVRLNTDDQGWLRGPGRDSHYPNMFISHVVVDIENLTPAPWYVTVYEVDRAYGGSEEGGWWYDTGTVVTNIHCKDERDAEIQATKMREIYKDTGESSSVIYSGGDYRVVIDNVPGQNYPQYNPHYA